MRSAVRLCVGLAALVALTSCADTPRPPSVSTYGEGPRPTDAALPVASGRALAALAISHLAADQVDSVGGFTSTVGPNVILAIDDGSTLYLSASPALGLLHATCARQARLLEAGERLLSCTRTRDALTAVTSTAAGRDHAITGFRVTGHGRVGVSVEPATDDGAARELVEALLGDSRIDYRTTADAMSLGEDLAGYEDLEVTLEAG